MLQALKATIVRHRSENGQQGAKISPRIRIRLSRFLPVSLYPAGIGVIRMARGLTPSLFIFFQLPAVDEQHLNACLELRGTISHAHIRYLETFHLSSPSSPPLHTLRALRAGPHLIEYIRTSPIYGSTASNSRITRCAIDTFTPSAKPFVPSHLVQR